MSYLTRITLPLCLALTICFGCAEQTESPVSPTPTPATGKLTVTVGRVAGTCEKCGLRRFNRHATVFAPAFNPANFNADTAVTNTFFPLVLGSIRVYYTIDLEGDEEQVRFEVLEETRQIAGVTCTALIDQVLSDGEVVEESINWYAVDQAGNVWHFGGEFKEIVDGEVIESTGWESGVDDAEPGIAMPADPQIGQVYALGFYADETEDKAEILSLDGYAEVTYGEFTGLLETRAWSPLSPEEVDFEYYAAGIGEVLTVNQETGERVELISFFDPNATD